MQQQLVHGQRVPVCCPPLPSVRGALDRSGGNGFAERVLAALSKGRQPEDAFTIWGQRQSQPRSVPVTALIKISGKTVQCDALTKWDNAEAAQRHMYNNPQDAYSVHIEDVR
eukprot:9979538-Lingulodinium_polyedra.AAC.1